jgi:hypothetical protein
MGFKFTLFKCGINSAKFARVEVSAVGKSSAVLLVDAYRGKAAKSVLQLGWGVEGTSNPSP